MGHPDIYDGPSGRALQLDGPAELLEFALDGGEGEFEGTAAVRAGGALGQDALALHFQCLEPTFLVGLGTSRLRGDGGGGKFWGRGLGLLLFDAFGFPTFRHGSILRFGFRTQRKF